MNGPLQASSLVPRDSCEPAVLTWSHNCIGDKHESSWLRRANPETMMMVREGWLGWWGGGLDGLVHLSHPRDGLQEGTHTQTHTHTHTLTVQLAMSDITPR